MRYPIKTRDQHFASDGEPKRILTLDGGGVRGVLALEYLQRIEHILTERYQHPEFRLCHYFDLIAGTSTGAIIAAALATGRQVAEIKSYYNRLTVQIFKKKWWRVGAVRPKFDAANLEGILKEALGEDTTLGSSRISTGLLVVTKRADTGSQWPLSNNPNGKYFRPANRDGTVANEDYLLWKVVRASTAAPHYFDPEQISIHPDQSPGTFVDGGVSTANNPTLEAFKMATLDGFNLRWPTGPDRLLVVSCGTGRMDSSIPPTSAAASQALSALISVVDDCSDLVELFMQWISDSPSARLIDSEVGDLSRDVLTQTPLLTYRRYNVMLGKEWIRSELGMDLTDRKVGELGALDNVAGTPLLAEIGRRSSAKHISEGDLPAWFDLV